MSCAFTWLIVCLKSKIFAPDTHDMSFRYCIIEHLADCTKAFISTCWILFDHKLNEFYFHFLSM